MIPSAIYKKVGNIIKVDIVETNLNHLLVNKPIKRQKEKVSIDGILTSI